MNWTLMKTGSDQEVQGVHYKELSREVKQTDGWGGRSYIRSWIMETGVTTHIWRRGIKRWRTHSTHTVDIHTRTRARLCHPLSLNLWDRSKALPSSHGPKAMGSFTGLCPRQQHTFSRDFTHWGFLEVKALHSVSTLILFWNKILRPWKHPAQHQPMVTHDIICE